MRGFVQGHLFVAHLWRWRYSIDMEVSSMKRAIVILASTLLLLLAACGGSTTPSLTVSPTSVTVTAGDGPVSFSATLSGASGAISWNLSPNLGTLSSNSGPSVSYTPPATVASEQTVTLTASAAGLNANATITIEPRKTDVNGVVTDLSGNPLSGKKVFIPGHQLQTTDDEGKFSFSNVVVPYTVIVEYSSSQYDVYEGLTRSDPRISAGNGLAGGPYGAQVYGSVSNTTSGNKLGIQGAGEGCMFARIIDSSADNTSYDASVSLYKKTCNLDVYALEWANDVYDNAANFVSLGKRADVALVDNGNFHGIDIQLSQLNAPTTHDLSVTLSPPSSLTPAMEEAIVKLSPAGVPASGVPTASFNTTNTMVTFKSPNINSVSDARMTVWGAFTDSDDNSSMAWDTVPVSSNSITIGVPEPPAISEPANNTTGVTPATNFAWSGPDDAFYFVEFRHSNSFVVYIYTAAKQTHLPDLSAFNVNYPSNASFDVQVVGYNINGIYESDPDQFTDPNKLPPGIAFGLAYFGSPLSDSGFILGSKKISVTTAN